MKRYLVLCVTVCMTATVFAQEKKEKSIAAPTAAKVAFEKAFPGSSKVRWEHEKAGYEVNFVQDGKEMSAVYDAKGVLKETENEITIDALPAGVTAYVKQHYNSAPIKEAAKITKAGGEVVYEAEVNKMDVLFDANGKFIKAKKD
ncbi:PepSY-like domain-containing protein [Chitinophagaceae bacterium MMS25-I14]